MPIQEDSTFSIASVPIPETPPSGNESRFLRRALPWALLILALGALLRIALPAGYRAVGFDEQLYRKYLIELDSVGLLEYRQVTNNFIHDQRDKKSICKLPPTRFLYVFSGWIWKRAEFGDAPPLAAADSALDNDPALVSLRRVSRLFSVLLLALTGIASWRMFGIRFALPAMALMAFAPLQLHMAGHVLIDGFFSFWAALSLYLLWENLNRPNHPALLAALSVSLALLVTAKENAFFVVAALAVLLIANRWLKFGNTTGALWAAMGIGPILGVACLVFLAGSAPRLIEVYRLLVIKAEHLDYAIATGDGPWQRYLVDEMIVNPIVLCLALAAALHLARHSPALLYLTGFTVLTYAVMCSIPYGMNLRYATIWDFPLCALAAAQVIDLSHGMRKYGTVVLILACFIICASDMAQYWRLFVTGHLYELPTEGLLRALHVIKRM